ncbi:MAG: outer membrane beta-barrel protein [Thiolinea sp.]
MMKASYLALPLLLIPLVASAEKGWYGVVSLGKVTETPDLFEVNTQGDRYDHYIYNNDGDHGSSSGRSIKNLAAGYSFNKNLASELEWQSRSWKTYYNYGMYGDDFKSKNNAFLLNGIYQLPIKNQVSIYAKGSLGMAHHSISTTNDFQAGYFYPKSTNTTAAFGLGAGVKVDISKNFGLGLEYRRMDLGQISSANEQNSKLTFDLQDTELTGSMYIYF